MLRVPCPAKINLFLEVLGKRPDGYHEIATLMAPISLHDTLEMRPAKKDVLLVEPHDAAPADDSNTVLKALSVLRRSLALPPVRIRLKKRIPTGAGLGGGSSDAAATVHAANRLFKLGLSPTDEASLLAVVGSDTAFFAHRGWALCRGRGEIIEPFPGRTLPLVIVAPHAQNPTPEIYKHLQLDYKPRSVPRPQMPTDKLLFNRLETPAFEYRPELADLKAKMSTLPFEGVLMTGSGSALFGVCRARQQRALAKECRHPECTVYVAQTLR